MSILPQQEFAEQIAGSIDIDVMVLIPPGASPATYELTPSQMKTLSRVNIYFKIGTHIPFEQVWLNKIIDLNPEMLIVDCSKGIEILSGIEDSIHSDNHHSNSKDPHIWCSPVNAGVMVANMTDGLIEIDPAREKDYRENAASYLQQLEELNIEIAKMFENKINRKFIIFHPSWGYFAHEYNLIQIPIEIEGKEPRATDLKRLISMTEREKLNVVFASPQFNTESAGIIAAEIGGSVEYLDPLRKDYLKNLKEAAIKLADTME